MNWIVEIGKTNVHIVTDTNYKSSYEVKPGWQAGIDKMSEFIMVKLSCGDKTIYLAMLPVNDTSVIWRNIDDAYKIHKCTVKDSTF